MITVFDHRHQEEPIRMRCHQVPAAGVRTVSKDDVGVAYRGHNVVDPIPNLWMVHDDLAIPPPSITCDACSCVVNSVDYKAHLWQAVVIHGFDILHIAR